MKTITPLVMLLVLASSSMQAQQLPNSGFETWSHKSITEPIGFFTSNAIGKMFIYNCSGKLEAEQVILESNSYIYTNKLATGLYLYRITGYNGIALKNGKFIKE